MTRLEANKLILKIIDEYISQYPDMRFSQALSNLNIVDMSYADYSQVFWVNEFHLESEKLLERIKDNND